jgi:hypothetical protein
MIIAEQLMSISVSSVSDLLAAVESTLRSNKFEEQRYIDAGALLNALRSLENSRCPSGPPAAIITALLSSLRSTAIQVLST